MSAPSFSGCRPEDVAADANTVAGEKCSSPAESALDEPSIDPNTVDWDSVDDASNPMNWSSVKKNVQVAVVSLFTLTGNLASTMFAPGAPQLAQEFHVNNPTVEALTVTLYVLGFAVGPLILAPLSELYGRLVVYYFCNVFYLAFTLGCTLSTNIGMFLAFRLLCGCAASGPMTIGGGTIADTRPQEKRGKAIAFFAMGPLVGPVIGPIAGGFVSQHIGWRWTFWIILILSGSVGLATVIFMRETNAAVLLQKKTVRIRKETGNPNLVPKMARTETPGQIFLRAIVRPLKLLLFSPIVLLLSLYTGVMFGLVFLLFATFPSVFQGTYGFNAGTSGLAYLGLGIGMLFGLVLFGVLSDKLLGHNRNDSPVRPEERLILMKWFGPITPLGCFMYGWTADYGTHWIAPILGTFIIGFGSLFVVMPTQVYLVDSFGPEAAASAMAANLIVRAPFGAFLGLAAAPLYEKLGLGWGNSVLGFITLVFTPVPWLFYRYGERLRTRFAVEL